MTNINRYLHLIRYSTRVDVMVQIYFCVFYSYLRFNQLSMYEIFALLIYYNQPHDSPRTSWSQFITTTLTFVLGSDTDVVLSMSIVYTYLINELIKV